MKIINPKTQYIMKHFTQTTANGLCTPPCGSSQSKSTRFSLLTSLLLFFLLFVGSNAAWATSSTAYFTPNATIYFHVTNDCRNWGNDGSVFQVILFDKDDNTKAIKTDNSTTVVAACDAGGHSDNLYNFTGDGHHISSDVRRSTTRINDNYYSFTIPASGKSVGYIRIIRNVENGWVHAQQPQLSADDVPSDKNCFAYSAWSGGSVTFEAYSFTEPVTTGGGDPEPEPGQQTLTESYCLRGDLWLNGANDPAWESAGTIPSPSFTANNDNTIATLSYVIPAISEGAITSRITLHGNDHSGSNYKPMKTVWDSEHSNITQNDGWTDEKGLLNVPQQGSFSPKKITLEVTKDASGEHLKGTISDYTVKRDGWHLYVDNHWVGEMDNNGEFLLLNAGYEANNAHTVFVTNSKRDGEITRPDQYWSQGISWFGGLYIDKSNSNVSWGTQYKYYGDKFSNQPVFPTVGTKDARGRFKIGNSAAEAVKFTFDGGKITINTLSRQNISGTTYCLTGIFNGWNNSNRAMTWSNDTKAHTYTLSNVTSDYSKNEHGWKAFKIVPSGSWEGQIHGTSATIIVNGVVVPYDSDNECTTCGYNTVADNRILVQVDEASDITFNYYQYTGGINIVDITRTAYVAPVNTYTVTIHPNPNNVNETIVRSNVPEKSNSSAAALDLSNITYGNGTATWYTNEACTTPFSTVTGDMDLYAKWGISGQAWLVGDLWMYNNSNFSGGLGANPEMTVTNGVATYTYIAPAGKNRLEAYRNGDGDWWNRKISGESTTNTSSGLSWSEGVMQFTLDAPKKVTITYNGKFSLAMEDYTLTSANWRVTCDGWDGNSSWSHTTALDATGHATIRNVNPGTHLFKITQGLTQNSEGLVGEKVFNALYVDTSSPSSGLTWASETTNYGRTGVPQEADGNQYRNCKFTLANDANAINGKYDLQVTFDGGKIRCDILPKRTVTFKDGETTLSTVQVFDGGKVTAAVHNKSGYDFVKWHEAGSNTQFDFVNTAITGNLDLYGEWVYKHISSVSLNESTHSTWVGNSDFTLTPTYSPSDVNVKSVAWTSDAEGVATVSNGTVHAVSAGTATITCTVTDMFDTQRSATCEVTVAACQMTTDDLYSMTVTGYNMHDGDDADLGGLWNESSDNTEPASMTITRLAFHKKDAGNTLYAYDDNGTVKMKEDASGNDVQWILIPVGENYTPSWNGGNACQLYYIKNVSTGKFMHRGTQGQDGSGFNVQWWYSVTNTNATNAATDDYKWFFVNENDNQRGVYVKSGVGDSKPNSYKLHSSNEFNNCTDTYAPKPMLPVGRTADMNDYAKSYKNTNDFNYDTYSNPNYKASQMNSAYYRMKADATVRANLENALVYGSVITVRLYADAATTVQLTKADGTEIETIDLNADAVREFTYTVAYGSELVGETAFVIKAADNHAGIASIEVSRTHAASPADPELAWEANLSGGVTQSALGGTFQHVASSDRSEGAIHYASSNPAVATVAANGTVTPIMAGSTTITATIEQHECYAESSVSYNVTLTEPTLAELIDADEGAGITLTHDYAENIVIDKEITINGGGHSIGNLTVETAGDLTLSGALTVNDFSIYAKAGNTTTPAASGQVRSADKLTVNGNAYFLYTVDPNGHVQYGWYDFTVPFRVNVMTGIKGIQEGVLKENFVNETDYAIMEHLGEKQAAGEYAYKKFRGVMEPCRLYSITLDPRNNYNTIRFQKADGDLVASDEVTLNTYASTVDDKHANWNGVGNGTLHHADAGLSVATTIQVYQSGNKTFLPVDKKEYSLVVGSAFMVQQAGTMTLNQASHDKLLAPRRDASVQPTAIQIASEGQPFSDQLFISADETAGQGYTQGADVAKAGNIGNVNVPQIWTNAYDSKLCAHEAQLINGQAAYALSLYAPANGTYTLTSKNIPEGYTLYLTQNGNKIWDMSDAYVIDLTKGTTNEYGLLLVERYNAPTAVENIGSKADETQKIMHNGILYILRNGKVFNAQGARVK